MNVVLFGWETPFVFQYGGLGTFGREVVRALVSLGHKVVWCGAVPAGQGVNPVRMFEGAYTALPVAEVRDLGPADVAGIRAACSRAAQALAPTADAIITNDRHVITALDAAFSAGVPAAHFTHTVSGDPIEAGYVMELGAFTANSRLVADAVRSFAEGIASMIAPRPKVPEARVAHLPPPRIGEPDPALVRRYREAACGGEADCVVIGTLSRNQDFKNAEILPAVVRELRRRGWRAAGLIAGAGRPEGKPAPHVTSVGYVPEARKPSFYAALNAFILTSVFEPYGLTALEAIVAGAPAVIPPNSGVAEVLTHAPKAGMRNPKEIADAVEKALTEGDTLEKERNDMKTLPTWEEIAAQLIANAKTI